jgi:hypothetical protein
MHSGISGIVNPSQGRCPQCERVLHDDKCPKCGKYWWLHRGDSPWEKFWLEHNGHKADNPDKRNRMARYV